MLMRARAGTEEVTQFIVAATEPVSRPWALEPTHRLVATFDATMILLITAGAVLHAFTQRRPDRTRVAVVAIRGHPVRDTIGDGPGGLEERLRRSHVAVNITSTSAPLRSMARYRWRQCPCTLMYVSSTYQLFPIRPRRDGASLQPMQA
jgi:hypothetical protein